MNKILQIYVMYIILLVFNILILVSKLFFEGFVVLIITIVLYLFFILINYSIKIKNPFYYLIVTLFFIISYFVDVTDPFRSVIFIGVICLVFIILTYFLKLKGIKGKVIDSTDKYSIIYVEPDVLLIFRPGYYILEKKLEKGKEIIILGVDFFETNKITKFKEI